MIPVISQNEAYSLDRDTIDSCYLSEDELMDNAGQSIAQFIVENIPDSFNQNFILLIGPGNNGKDGIICHYYLSQYGIRSKLFILDENIISDRIFKNYFISKELILFVSDEFEYSLDNWYVDCMFGVGVKRSIKGHYKDVIKKIKNLSQVISIDIPSGIYCDTGMMAGAAVIAKYTLTLGYPKWGHYFNNGIESSGDLHVLDIGFKPISQSKNYVQLIELADILSIAPTHTENLHKYSRGKVISIAGSSDYIGAGILSINAALSAGAGVVKAIVPSSMQNIYSHTLIEPILVPIDDKNRGTYSKDDVDKILDEVAWADVLMFGPGLMTDHMTIEWMAKVLSSLNIPLILDASGFQPLIDKKIIIDNLPKETILTPHYAEFSKIFNIELQKVVENPVSSVKDVINQLNGRILILKGSTNIIVTSEGEIYLMNRGTSALATAGTGDVLAGILSASISQGLNINDAAVYSAYIHAECACQYSKNVSRHGLTASDLIDMLPFAQEEIFHVL